MYGESSRIPLIFAGKPIPGFKGMGYENRLCEMADLMPTLLSLCGLDIPSTVEGMSIFVEKERDYIYGEVSEGEKATRMIRDREYKLVYYPCGNVKQLFDMKNDRKECHNLYGKPEYGTIAGNLEKKLMDNLYGDDLRWIRNGRLVGFEAPEKLTPKPDFGLYNQRGYHWPQPKGYSNKAKNA